MGIMTTTTFTLRMLLTSLIYNLSFLVYHLFNNNSILYYKMSNNNRVFTSQCFLLYIKSFIKTKKGQKKHHNNKNTKTNNI